MLHEVSACSVNYDAADGLKVIFCLQHFHARIYLPAGFGEQARSNAKTSAQRRQRWYGSRTIGKMQRTSLLTWSTWYYLVLLGTWRSSRHKVAEKKRMSASSSWAITIDYLVKQSTPGLSESST